MFPSHTIFYRLHFMSLNCFLLRMRPTRSPSIYEEKLRSPGQDATLCQEGRTRHLWSDGSSPHHLQPFTNSSFSSQIASQLSPRVLTSHCFFFVHLKKHFRICSPTKGVGGDPGFYFQKEPCVVALSQLRLTLSPPQSSLSALPTFHQVHNTRRTRAVQL